MSRRQDRVPFRIDASGVHHLPDKELRAILRGADMMIGVGGRTQLSKLLKGSRAAELLERGLDRCPAYGFYRELSTGEILKRIDWAIENHYLSIEYSGRLPVLIFTPAGWEIEEEAMAEELLAEVTRRLFMGFPYEMEFLMDRNRGMIFLLLDKVAAAGRRELIPVLQAWAMIECRKVRARINQVIAGLRAATAPG